MARKPTGSGDNGCHVQGPRPTAPGISWPYVGEVARSLLGVLLAIVAALHWGTGMGVPGAAIAAGGSAAIAGATALQDSPHGRLPLVVGVSFAMGAAVLVGSLTSRTAPLFVVTVTLWCLAAGMVWAISANAGLVAAAASALLVTCPAMAGSPSAALTAAALAVVRRADPGCAGGRVASAALAGAAPRARPGPISWVATSARTAGRRPRGRAGSHCPDRAARGVHADRESGPSAPAGLPRPVRPAGANRDDAERITCPRPATPAVRDALLASADVLAAVADGGHGARAMPRSGCAESRTPSIALTGARRGRRPATAGAGGRGLRPAFHRRRAPTGAWSPNCGGPGSWARCARSRVRSSRNCPVIRRSCGMRCDWPRRSASVPPSPGSAGWGTATGSR